MSKSSTSSTALILAGAVAKGAFEAGVLDVLAEHEIAVARVVGASAGSLNGAVYAAGIRAGKEKEAAKRLVHLWQDRADWSEMFRVSLSDLLARRGFGTMEKVLTLLNDATSGFTPQADRHVDLRLVLTALRGSAGKIGSKDATTFEHIARFSDNDFDSPKGWASICEAAVASASFPGAFVPKEVERVGPCLDGGIVNNTPVKWALEGGGIDRIIVVTPNPREIHATEPFKGRNLLGHFIDILINERLYRDLREAESVNDHIRRLDALVVAGSLSVKGRDAVCDAYSWRPLEIIQVRPVHMLDGNPFKGFSDPRMRGEYIEAGREAAKKALGPLRRTAGETEEAVTASTGV